MVQIEVNKYGISGVFLDGYMPDFSELKKIDWDYALEHRLYKAPWMRERFNKIRKHLEPGARNQSAIIRSAIYGNLVENVRFGFCPYRKIGKWPCSQWFHPSKGPDATKYSYAVSLNMSPAEAYNIFNADDETDIEEKREYSSVIIVVDRRPKTGCHVFKDCNRNWMDFLKYESKKRKHYSNFEIFNSSVKIILKLCLRSSDSGYFDDQRLRLFFLDD